MQSAAHSVQNYLRELPEDRRKIISSVRRVILKNLNEGFEEGMQYGMIGYYVPHSRYPAGYHCDPKQPLPFACLASQKNYLSLYLLSAYGLPEEEQWLRKQFAAAGKKLDMGKSCIRFKKLEDLPLDVVGEAFRRMTVDRHIEVYETTIRSARSTQTKTSQKTVARKSTPSEKATKTPPKRSQKSASPKVTKSKGSSMKAK